MWPLLVGAMLMAEPVPPEAPRFLAIGDSYTIGESVETAQRWPMQLARRLRERGVAIADPVIIARTGWTTDELARALDRAEAGTGEDTDGNGGSLRPPYALVSLLIGVNNQYRGRAAEEFRGELRDLIARALRYAGGRARGVIVLSIPDWGATPFGAGSGRERTQITRDIDAYNAVVRDESERAGVRFIDITPGTREAPRRPELVAGDGLHPSAVEYARWVEAALPVVMDRMREP